VNSGGAYLGLRARGYYGTSEVEFVHIEAEPAALSNVS